VGDITDIHTWAGFIYLATVIDCYSKKVVGWSIADSLAHRTHSRPVEERSGNNPDRAQRDLAFGPPQRLHLDQFSGPGEATAHVLLDG
jgi:transposase InsO family protein